MRYFDTSFLAPLVLEEATSARVERFIAALPPEELAVSHWTGTEFASLLAREVRMGGLRAAEATETAAEFEAIMAESFVILLPGAEDFDLARRFLGNYATGLRAGDALHLAIAANRKSEAIYSLDNRMVQAGRMLRLPISRGIRLPA